MRSDPAGLKSGTSITPTSTKRKKQLRTTAVTYDIIRTCWDGRSMYRSNAPHILAVVQVQTWGRQFTVATVGATAACHFEVPSSSPVVLGRRSLEVLLPRRRRCGCSR